jgi:hypothetical protein
VNRSGSGNPIEVNVREAQLVRRWLICCFSVTVNDESAGLRLRQGCGTG